MHIKTTVNGYLARRQLCKGIHKSVQDALAKGYSIQLTLSPSKVAENGQEEVETN